MFFSASGRAIKHIRILFAAARVAGVSRLDRIRNEEIRQTVQQRLIVRREGEMKVESEGEVRKFGGEGNKKRDRSLVKRETQEIVKRCILISNTSKGRHTHWGITITMHT